MWFTLGRLPNVVKMYIFDFEGRRKDMTVSLQTLKRALQTEDMTVSLDFTFLPWASHSLSFCLRALSPSLSLSRTLSLSLSSTHHTHTHINTTKRVEGMTALKRALYTLRRALHIHKRALRTLKRVLYTLKRTLQSSGYKAWRSLCFSHSFSPALLHTHTHTRTRTHSFSFKHTQNINRQESMPFSPALFHKHRHTLALSLLHKHRASSGCKAWPFHEWTAQRAHNAPDSRFFLRILSHSCFQGVWWARQRVHNPLETQLWIIANKLVNTIHSFNSKVHFNSKVLRCFKVHFNLPSSGWKAWLAHGVGTCVCVKAHVWNKSNPTRINHVTYDWPTVLFGTCVWVMKCTHDMSQVSRMHLWLYTWLAYGVGTCVCVTAHIWKEPCPAPEYIDSAHMTGARCWHLCKCHGTHQMSHVPHSY